MQRSDTGYVCLINGFFDNLMHRCPIHASTIYIQSSLLRGHSCHTTHAGIITQSSLCACVRTCEVKLEMLVFERRTATSEDITSSHLSLITCFVFLWVPLFKSDILGVIFLVFCCCIFLLNFLFLLTARTLIS